MAENVTYYAIVRSTQANRPAGLARRKTDTRRALSTRHFGGTSAGSETQRSSNGSVATSGAELVEISEAEAAELIERFRAEWGEPD